MAITLGDLETMLDDAQLRYMKIPEGDAILVGFTVEKSSTYRDKDGDPHVPIVLRLVEDGEFLSAFSPACWTMTNPVHRPSVCEVLVASQSTFKLIRYDVGENFVIPNVEVALEDGSFTADQLQRVIGVLLQAIKKYDIAIRRAIETGVVSMHDVRDPVCDDEDHEGDDEGDEGSPSSPPIDPASDLLELADEAGGLDGGGIDALERLLGGDGSPPIGL